MSAGFTPGPWGIDGLSLVHGPDQTRGGQRVVIAKVQHNAAANANLIAAAPELLEAAEHMLVANESESGTHYAAAIEKLQAAVRKANGEQVHSDPLPKEVGR